MPGHALRHLASELATFKPSAVPVSAEQEAEIPSQTQRPLDVGQAADAVVLADYSPPGVVVNAALEIVQFRGHTEPYLRHVPGKASLGLLEMAPGELAVHLGAAVGDARRSGEPTVRSDVAFHAGGRDELLTLHVVPLPTMGGELHFVVLFESRPAVATKGRTAKATHPQLEETRRELSATRDYLQTVIEDKETANEELRASNEEVQSANEELQSINEELETAKEELQSTNEELVTVNDELRGRNVELGAITDDLSNLFESTDIPLIMLGRDLRVRRLTPAMREVFGVAAGALDLSLLELDLPFDLPDLAALAREVIDTLAPKAVELQDRQGRWFAVRVRPFLTVDSAVAGAVVAFVDVDAIKRSAEEIRETALLNAALASIHLEVSSALGLDEILTRALVESTEALQAETASIVLREDDAWVTRYACGYGAEVLGARFTDAELPHVILAAGTRAPVAISHAGEDARIGLKAVRLLRLRSVLAVPLVSSDEVSGVLLFNWHDRSVTLSAGQIDFAAKMASAVSLALDNARLNAERAQNVRLAQALHDVSTAISSASTVKAIVESWPGRVCAPWAAKVLLSLWPRVRSLSRGSQWEPQRLSWGPVSGATRTRSWATSR